MPERVHDTAAIFRPVDAGEVERLHAIEAASYPEDEAASRESLAFRAERAADAFLVATLASEPDVAIGFVCGTRTRAEKLTHESMSNHDADGALLCIHSVVVDEQHRRRGVGAAMLRAYVRFVKAQQDSGVRELRLMCKKPLIEFYAAAGFELLGESDVVHGQDKWYEMRQDV